MTDSLRDVYANYLLGFNWDAYYTQTFKHKRNDGFNATSAWWNKMEGKLGWTRSFVAVEKHRLGGVHLHALVADDLQDWSNSQQAQRELEFRLKNSAKYTEKAFGWSNVSCARNQATVNLYVTKYVTKGSEEFFMLGHWDKEDGL